MPRYDFKRIESRWQQYWDEHQTFRTDEAVSDRRKLYVLDMFPYPSGSGLHVGHPEGYTATDIVCRYSRMKGLNVLHPMGWDAFGLPAEEHAVKTGTHPRITTEQNIDTFRRQLKMLGFSYDWTRELATTDPDYYRWTQWIFLQIFDTWYDADCVWTGSDGVERRGKGRPISELPIPREILASGGRQPSGTTHGNANDRPVDTGRSPAVEEAIRRYQDKHRLAYVSDAPVNWCPALGTVLANEEIIDGKSERGGHPVVRMPLKQWMLRITAYADRLASELDDLDWSESIKFMQRNWIGRSTGTEVDFFVDGDVSASSGRQPSGTSAAFESWKASRQSTGFPREPESDVIRIYTTRPDTLFGVTYMVLAPEHLLVNCLTTDAQRPAVDEYIRRSSLKSDLDRTDLAKEKSGVFTGGYAINPVNGERVPVWIADYVLISYGTGAIMAVPGHDERDWEFAKTFNLQIRTVVTRDPGEPDAGRFQSIFVPIDPPAPFTTEGLAVNSGKYTGLTTSDFKSQISNELADAGLGKEAVNYRLRDWLFSRQRYWGEPFPVWHELDANGHPTGLMRTDSVESLPVLHPHMDDFKPTGTPEPMLAKATNEWLFRTDPDGVKLKRETNSMPQWAGSCWYYLRFCDNRNSVSFIDPAKEKYWLPVDLYVGGAEHAVLHLLYSRFWHKVLFDRGCVSHPEPFQKLVNQGMILGEPDHIVFEDPASGEIVDPKSVVQVEENGIRRYLCGDRQMARVTRADVNFVRRGDVVEFWNNNGWEQSVPKGAFIKSCASAWVETVSSKMSKSRGNVVNPDDIVKEYGADSLRLYEMFMGPLEQMKPWQMNGVEGVYRFLGRVWRMMIDERSETVRLSDAVVAVAPPEDQLRFLHRTIKAVTDDIERLAFNTAISRMMEFTNFMSTQEARSASVLEAFVLLLSPFAPHIAEELWRVLGHSNTLSYESWPAYNPALLVEATIEIPVQVNGKLRGKIVVPANIDADALQAAARADETVRKNLDGKTIVKVVAVPGRMVNFVVK